MRRIISVLIAASIILSLTVPAFAAEPDEPQFGTIKVEYSDALGSIEALEVMVQDGYVYAEMRAFTSRLGLDCKQDGSLVSIFNSRVKLWSSDAPALALHYRVGSKEVSYNPLFGMEIAYTAPCPCVENERGVWLPLSYTLTLLGGSRNIAGDVLVVQMPSNNVLSIAATIRNNKSLLSFDWEDDFGYSEATSNITDGAARVVTLFSGLLKFDGSAWSSFVDWNAFDKKFGKTLAAMFCTNTADELKASIEEVELLVDVFADDGALGSMLRNEQVRIDSDVDAWKKICEEHLEKLKAGSGTLPQYNLAYQQYERAMNEQDLFSAVGADDLIHIQDELSTATNVLDKASKIGYAVSYLSEFQQRDAFQAAVLTNYFSTRKDTDEISDATAKAMADYASSNIVEYTASKFCQEHLLEILVDETGLDALMGAPANILLIAWDIMSETVPFYKDGLKDVDKREISNYAQQLQADALANVEALMVKLSTHADSLSAEDCVQLSEYCYIYLKACYIARTSAIESLENISKDAREKIQSKIDAETDVNKTIAQCLSVLSRAEDGNGCYILGFLPENSEEYLKQYSDQNLLALLNFGQSTSKQLTQINQYDDAGNLQIEKHIYYNENGQKTHVVRNNVEYGWKYTDTYVYDVEGRLIEYHDGGGEFDNYFTYNANGQKIKADLNYGWEWYEYDTQGRLCTVRGSYDVCDYVTTYYYDNSSKLISANTENIEYDGNAYTETSTYTYDSENRLIEELCEGGYSKTKYRYDYTFVNLTISEYLIENERSSIMAEYSDIIGISLNNPQFYADADGYLARVVDTYSSNGKVETTIYELYYDGELAVPLDTPTETTVLRKSVVAHTYDEAEKLLYEYLVSEYGSEGLEICQVSENGRFEMTISGEGGAPIYVINWYTVNLDTGEVRNAETYSVVCDLW